MNKKSQAQTGQQKQEAISAEQAWHTQEPAAVIKAFKTDAEQGLDSQTVKEHLDRYGYNRLPEAKPDTILTIFFRQFKSPLIYLLLAAAVVVLLLEEWIDGGIILFVLFFNAVAGTIQAGRAQNTLLALKRFTKTQATVVRDGREQIIGDEEVVPGDIILLQEGEKVPADARLIGAHNLRVSEAALTGESDPVGKFTKAIANTAATTPDQKNMLFKGSHVVAGTGRAVVVATGTDTVIGAISEKITTVDTAVPLEEDIRYLSRIIIGVVLAISVAIFLLGFFVGHFEYTEMFMLAVAVVVSAIPEGLPIVLTLLLATGVWRMSKRNVLVKNLQAVEALGEAQVIAVDKTGTITKNELVVQQVFTDGKQFTVSGVGYEPKGEIRHQKQVAQIADHPGLELIGRLGAFCSNARLSRPDGEANWNVAGDPTEAAMLVLAEKLGLGRSGLLKEYPQLDELPFDAKLKYHAALHRFKGEQLLAVAGAPEVVLEHASRISEAGRERSLTKDDRAHLTKIFSDMSRQGLRVIALAQRPLQDTKLTPAAVDELVFVGFLGMGDAIRGEVAAAMAATRAAGIRVVMITGDHKITAEAIAREAGIYREGDQVLTDQDIERMSDRELSRQLDNTTVFARITPEHKFRIVTAYRLRGEIIAMTGDGVNDALSLVAADLGVAMGQKGTEVAKEASDLVLLDDNFGSIVAAVEEGRGIYKNIKKVLLYLFSTSLGELMVIIAAILFGWPLPVLAAQLIWLNLVTDGFLVTALAMEKKEPGILEEKFVRPKKWIVDGWMTQRMLLMSATMAIVTLALFGMYIDGDYAKATTIALTTMVVFQWYKVLNCRSERKSIFRMNPFGNRYLVAAFIAVVGLHLLALYTALGQLLLRVTPLTLGEWGVILVAALSTIVVDELRKWVWRRFQNKDQAKAAPALVAAD